MFTSFIKFFVLLSIIFTDYTGAAPDDGRILVGRPATIKQFPYLVSIHRNGAHICGGTLIQNDLVLTAAHCVIKFPDPEGYTIRAGSAHKYEGGVTAQVQYITIHENYNRNSFDNDIAILALDSRLNGIPTARWLDVDDTVEDMTNLYVAGWGVISFVPKVSTPTLIYTVVQKIPDQTCKRSYTLTNNMMCAGSANGNGNDSCEGDSGGPLVTEDDKIVGIVSFGRGCGLRGYPGVYTKIQNYDQWIQEAMNE